MTPTDSLPDRSVQLNLPADEPEPGKEGVILAVLHSGMFRVRLPDRREIVAHLAGKLRLLPVRLLPGDRVRLQISRYDPSRGRILERL